MSASDQNKRRDNITQELLQFLCNGYFVYWWGYLLNLTLFNLDYFDVTLAMVYSPLMLACLMYVNVYPGCNGRIDGLAILKNAE